MSPTPNTLQGLVQGITTQVHGGTKYALFQRMYRNDREAFVHDILPGLAKSFADYQFEILSYFDMGKNRVAVRGPHGLGKTLLAAVLVHHALLTTEEDAKIITTASAWRQLEKYLWPEIKKVGKWIYWPNVGRDPYIANIEMYTQSIRLQGGLVEAFPVACEDSDTIEGAHASRLFYIFDEAKSIPRTTWDAAEGAFANAGLEINYVKNRNELILEGVETGVLTIDNIASLGGYGQYNKEEIALPEKLWDIESTEEDLDGDWVGDLLNRGYGKGEIGKAILAQALLGKEEVGKDVKEGNVRFDNVVGEKYRHMLGKKYVGDKEGEDGVELELYNKGKVGRPSKVELGLRKSMGIGERGEDKKADEYVRQELEELRRAYRAKHAGIEDGSYSDDIEDGFSKSGDVYKEEFIYGDDYTQQPAPNPSPHPTHPGNPASACNNSRHRPPANASPSILPGDNTQQEYPSPNPHLVPGDNTQRNIPHNIPNRDTQVYEAMAFAISTPGDPSGQFYDIHMGKPGYEDWVVRHVTLDEAIRAGRINRVWADQRRKQWGYTSSKYQNRVLGEFAENSDEGIIALAWVLEAMERWKAWNAQGRPQQPGKRTIGVDVARGGDDKTVLVFREAWVVSTIVAYSKRSTTSTAGEIQRRASGRSIHIETDGGLGAAVFDILRSEDVPNLKPITVSGATLMRDRSKELSFFNVRSAMWWNMRELLDPQYNVGLCLPPIEGLKQDLVTPGWDIDKGAIVKVWSKERIVERLGRSPDYGTACCLAFWNAASGGGVVV